MRSLLLSLLLLPCLVRSTYAQAFAFELIFEDNQGNRDTLVVGYDPLATDSIDEAFGETNILSEPHKPGIDVRVRNLDYSSFGCLEEGLTTFQSKKQIMRLDTIWYNISPTEIGIATDHWPVTAYWDSTLFEEERISGSFLTGTIPGGWFDVGNPAELWFNPFRDQASVTFQSNLSENDRNCGFSFGYIHQNDTIPRYWFQFRAYPTAVDDLAVEEPVSIFPNPAMDRVVVETALSIERLRLFDLTGREVQTLVRQKEIDVTGLSAGIYLLAVETDRGRWLRKVIKE